MIAVEPTRKTVNAAVRRATAEDRAAIMNMYAGFEPKAAALGLPPVDPERCGEWLDTLAAGANFVAIDAGAVVGHGVLFPEPDGASGEVAVFVHQDQRGRGVGKLLLTAIVEQARATGVQRVWGICEQDNIPMLRLARSCGFTESWSGEFYINLAPKPPQSNRAA